MSKIAKTTLTLMLVTMLSKILGFIRETVLVAVHGAGMTADAYITAMNIPNVIFATIGTALATTFIPLFFEIKNNEGEKKSLSFANNIFNIVIVLSLTLSTLGFIFAEPLTKIFAMDFDGEKLILATKFTKIMIYGMVFIGINNIMICWLQIKGKFTIPGMIGFPSNIIIIISILLSSKGNLNIMVVGSFLAIVSQFLFLYPFACKDKFKYKAYINLKDPYIKKMMYLILPIFIGEGVNQLNTVIDRSLASTLGDGIITVLNSANRLNGFVLALFIGTMVSVIYPMLSKLSSEDNHEELTKTITRSINTVSILIIPISIGAIILAEPVVRVIFERGKFDATATALTASALSAYSIGMIGFSLRGVMNRIFYSLKDTKTPMINGALAMGMNIILNIILIKFMGHIGLALATSISAIICIVLLFRSLKKKIDYFGQDKIMNTIFKAVLSGIIMGIITHFTYSFLSNILGTGTIQDILGLAGSIATGSIVYGIIMVLFKIEEIDIILNTFRRKLKLKQ